MAPKCGCLVYFFATSLLTMCVYFACVYVPCLKLEEKQLIDRSLHIGKMLLIYSSQKENSKVGFLCQVLFYGNLNRFAWLCGFITFLWLMLRLTVVGCKSP